MAAPRSQVAADRQEPPYIFKSVGRYLCLLCVALAIAIWIVMLHVAYAGAQSLNLRIDCATPSTCDATWDSVVGATAYRFRHDADIEWLQLDDTSTSFTPAAGLISGTARVEAFSRGDTLATDQQVWSAGWNTTTTSTSTTTTTTTQPPLTTTTTAILLVSSDDGHSISTAFHDQVIERNWLAAIGGSFLFLLSVALLFYGLRYVRSMFGRL